MISLWLSLVLQLTISRPMSTVRALVSFVISLSNATKTVVSVPSETENWTRYLQKEQHGQCVTWLVNTASHRQPKYLINVLSDRSPKDPNCFLMASLTCERCESTLKHSCLLENFEQEVKHQPFVVSISRK